MEDKKLTSLQDMLEELSTARLDELLQGELSKDSIDENAVRMIMGILRRREADYPVEVTPGIAEAWEKYRRSGEEQERKRPSSGKAKTWIIRAASAAAVVCILVLTVPQAVGAENIFRMLWRWTDEIFEYFTPGSADTHPEYVFETDHPGLQQVYDTVTDMGVTDPVVPMWLPEEAVLAECKVEETRAKKVLTAVFDLNGDQIVYKAHFYTSEVPNEYYKDGTEIIEYERDGTLYKIMRNNSRSFVTWTTGNIECAIMLDCQEDMLYKIINSI